MAAARSIGSGTIKVAYVNIPVKLYTAVASKNAITFNWLHKSCGSRLKQEYRCLAENVVVEREDTIKGFEYAPDNYVKFTDEELDAIEGAPAGEIQIDRFVNADSVAPFLVEKAFYLGPGKGSDRAFALFARVLMTKNRLAIAKWTHRGKDALVFVSPIEDENGLGLVIHRIFYADEVRSLAGIGLPSAEPTSIELQLGSQLIDALTSPFEHGAYHDRYAEKVRAAVETKVAGRDIVVTPTPNAAPIAMSLIDALDASVRAARSANDAEQPPIRGTKKAEPRATKRRKKGGDISA